MRTAPGCSFTKGVLKVDLVLRRILLQEIAEIHGNHIEFTGDILEKIRQTHVTERLMMTESLSIGSDCHNLISHTAFIIA